MRFVSLTLLAFVAACASSPRPAGPITPEPPTSASVAAAPSVTATVSAPAPSALPSASPSAQASAEPPQEAPNAACPADMKLVDGDYCSKVQHKCLKSWFDKSNKKVVCELFEEGSAHCVGTSHKKRYCIDTFSWPNAEGVRPEVMNNYYQAQVKCAAIGRRLCTESEWTMACEGPKMKPFPYGYVRDVNKCHGDVPWDFPNTKKLAKRDLKELSRLWKGVPNGKLDCVSDYGVRDLPGNNDEVVSTEDPTAKYDSATTGGPWYKGVRNQCRPKIYTHNEGFYYYYLGFRCCGATDGKEIDPRSPNQIKAKWKFDRVEKLAGFTREDVRQALEQKKKDGNCGCDAIKNHNKWVRCHTLCGTLLTPDTKDYR